MSTNTQCSCGHAAFMHGREEPRACTSLYCECRALSLAQSPAPQGASERAEANATPEVASTTQGTMKRAPERERMPSERASYTQVFRLKTATGLTKFYFTVGLYEDGRVGEVFIKADKSGSLASGSLDAVAILLSMLLQAGVPLDEVLGKIRGTRFEPAGFTGNPDVPNCTSPLDLLARWLEHKFLPKKEEK